MEKKYLKNIGQLAFVAICLAVLLLGLVATNVIGAMWAVTLCGWSMIAATVLPMLYIWSNYDLDKQTESLKKNDFWIIVVETGVIIVFSLVCVGADIDNVTRSHLNSYFSYCFLISALCVAGRLIYKFMADYSELVSCDRLKMNQYGVSPKTTSGYLLDLLLQKKYLEKILGYAIFIFWALYVGTRIYPWDGNSFLAEPDGFWGKILPTQTLYLSELSTALLSTFLALSVVWIIYKFNEKKFCKGTNIVVIALLLGVVFGFAYTLFSGIDSGGEEAYFKSGFFFALSVAAIAALFISKKKYILFSEVEEKISSIWVDLWSDTAIAKERDRLTTEAQKELDIYEIHAWVVVFFLLFCISLVELFSYWRFSLFYSPLNLPLNGLFVWLRGEILGFKLGLFVISLWFLVKSLKRENLTDIFCGLAGISFAVCYRGGTLHPVLGSINTVFICLTVTLIVATILSYKYIDKYAESLIKKYEDWLEKQL